jgi:hypothetical protein
MPAQHQNAWQQHTQHSDMRGYVGLVYAGEYTACWAEEQKRKQQQQVQPQLKAHAL